MSLPLDSIVALYSYTLSPIPLLTTLGLPVSILDLVGTFRLALVVQQIKHDIRVRTMRDRLVDSGTSDTEKEAMTESLKVKLIAEEQGGALSTIWSMLVIVYGGELLVCEYTPILWLVCIS